MPGTKVNFESDAALTVSLHGGDEVSVQEEVHVGEVGGGSPVHHHVVQHLNATHAGVSRDHRQAERYST